MKKAELFFNAILVPLDYLMFFLAGVAAYYLRVSETISGWRPVLFELSLTPGEYYRTVFAVALFGVGVFALSGLYKIKKNFRSLQEFFLIVTATSAGLLAVVFYLFLFRQGCFRRLPPASFLSFEIFPALLNASIILVSVILKRSDLNLPFFLSGCVTTRRTSCVDAANFFRLGTAKTEVPKNTIFI